MLALAGATAMSSCASHPAPDSDPTPRADSPQPPHREQYGDDPAQFGDLYLPSGPARAGTVVVIHGGFWQSNYGLDLGAAISADLARRGRTAWNIEYRRLGNGGGWPTTFLDVAAAIDHLATLDVDTGRVVTLGHSAGGQLAVWAAGRDRTPGGSPVVRLTGAIAQAGVLDLAGAARSGLGGTAVLDLLGGSPEAVAKRYAAVDPLALVPAHVPVRCVHGTSDVTVPLTQSKAYVDAARAGGADAELIEVEGDHFAVIDPTTSAWRRTVDALTSLTGSG